MNIYVAGKWEETEAVRAVQELVRQAGHIVSYDWTRYLKDLPLRLQAIADLEGVLQADAVIFLNHPRCAGAFTEIGIAIGQQIPVVVVKPELKDNIFFNLDRVYSCQTASEAVQLLGHL